MMDRYSEMFLNTKEDRLLLTRDQSLGLKGIAIMMMLFHHLFAFPDRYPIGYEFSQLTQMIAVFCKVCVPIFLFISGYGFVKSKRKSFRDFITRILEFYLHYWLVFIIFVPLSVLNRTVIVTPQTLILNFLGIKTTYLGEWWFITLYLLLLLITPLFYKISSKMLLLTSLFISIASFFTYRTFSSSDWYYLVPDLVPIIAYSLGFLVGRHEMQIIDLLMSFKTNHKYLYVWLSTILTLSTVIIGIKFSATLYLTIPITILILRNLYDILGMFRNAAKKFGNYSIYIWLTHSFYCYKFIPGIVYGFKNPILIFVWLLALSYLTALILDCIYKFISKQVVI